MKKVISILFFLLTIGALSVVRGQLTFLECIRKAHENYPLIKQYDLIERTKEYNLSNAEKGYFPQLSFSGKASYQTQVTELPISLPNVNIERMNKDQYGITADLTQVVWDGGMIRSKKEVTKIESDVERNRLDADLYKINEKINGLFFGILLLESKIKQNELLMEELQRNYENVSGYADYGIANRSDLDVIKAEQLAVEQRRIQLESNRKTYLQLLGTWIGEELSGYTSLQRPEFEPPPPFMPDNHPEWQFLNVQLESLEARKGLIKAGYMPKIGLFGTLGYGNPGLNMLKPEFSSYFIGGIKISWNFGNLYTRKNDNRLVEVNKSFVLNRREAFLFNTTLEYNQQWNEIQKNKELLKYDDEIIMLRENIKKAAEAKVANGTGTVTDLLKEVTAEDMARQDKIRHEIELLQSVHELKYTVNN